MTSPGDDEAMKEGPTMTTNNTDGAALLPVTAEEYLIRKGGAYYRPNAAGYTNNVAEAGRYSLEDAIRHSHPNGPNGPRDGIDYMPAPARQSHSLPGDVGTEKLRGLSERAAPAPWVVYSEPEVGLFASVFSGTVMETGFAPVNLDDPSNVEFIVEAVNFARAILSSPLPATQEDAERSGAGDSHRCETPLEISKRLTDAKTAILRNAVERRRETSTPQRQEYDGGAVREALKEAYRKGATDVHNYWQNNPGEPPQGDPEFGEAASDYAASALDIFDSSAAAALNPAQATPSAGSGETGVS